MTHRTPPHRFAGAAIAAVLALGSTPLWSQDIAPVAAPPAPVAAPVPQPTIVLPPVTAAPAAPVIAPVPEPVTAAPVSEPAAPRAERPRAAAPAARAVPTRVAPAAVASGPVTPEPVETIRADVSTPAVAPVDPVASAEPVVEETAAPAESDSNNVLPLAGLLAALGLGGIALFATRRRRRQPDEVEPVMVAREPIATVPPRTEYATSPAVAAPAFVAPPMRLQQSTQESRPIWQEPRRAVSTPASAQASVHNRQALLDRMVAAEPDANNPFTSGKARRRRARLMLQSMDNQRWDDTELEPGFDWREQARATRERETVSA